MSQMASLPSKHLQKKKNNSKKTKCHQSLQTNFTNTFTPHKTQQNRQTQKKTPVLSEAIVPSLDAKARPLSGRKVKLSPPAPTKNGQLSARRESTGRAGSGKVRKVKNKSQFMKCKLGALQAQRQSEPRSFFPLTQEEKDLQEHKSYLIAENGEKMQPEIEDFVSSRQEAAELPFDSMFVAKVPPRYIKFFDESEAVSREGLSKRDWEAFEAVKLKNEELTNYVEELQKIQQKILEEEEAKRKALEKKYQSQKTQLLREIKQLRDEHSRLNQTNATLQQLFNEGKQNLDIMTRRCNQLASSARPVLKKDQQSASVEAVQRRITELEQEIVRARNSVDYFVKENNNSQLKLRVCQSDKEEIKNKAQQMLELLRAIQGSYHQ